MISTVRVKSVLFLIIILLSLSGFDKWFEVNQQARGHSSVKTRPQIKNWMEVDLNSGGSVLDIYFPGSQSIWLYRHRKNHGLHALLITYFQEQQGEELINSANRLFESQLGKPELTGETGLVVDADKTVKFQVSRIAVADSEITVVSHYQVFNKTTTSELEAKLLSIGKLFYPESASRQMVFLLQELDYEDNEIRSDLADFYAQMTGYGIRND